MGRRVVLDPGHVNAAGYPEHAFARDVALRVRKILGVGLLNHLR